MGTILLVYGAGLLWGAVLFLIVLAYAARMRGQAQAAAARLEAALRRESEVLEAVRVVTAASRDSSGAVLAALERTLRVLDPSLDAVLVFTPLGEDLACVHAGGARAEYFGGARFRLDDPAALPARAALCGHRLELGAGLRAVIPTDRAAIAVPMLGGDGLAAVVYASTRCERIGNPDALTRAAAHAAAPFTLAAEREADRHSATYDGLTGLYTPRAFRARLHDELARARAAGCVPLALWFIDTDRFKTVNDTLGHAAGDVVLQRMAHVLREHTVAGVDLAARNGGDEFCAILRGVHKIAAIERAQRFCEAVRACEFGIDARITASIGVAAFPYDASEAGELLEAADAAMYHSKRSGRDRVSFASGAGTFFVFSREAR